MSYEDIMVGNGNCICEECGKEKKSVIFYEEYSANLCPQCLMFYKEHPKHDLPEKGEILYDELGRPICHICGRAFNKVLNHARQKHFISAEEYKRIYGLISTKGICSQRTKDRLRAKVMENYDTVVLQNLVEKGNKTRYKNGHKGRPKEKLRIQSLNTLKANMEKINEKR